jgi:hypothetical protein
MDNATKDYLQRIGQIEGTLVRENQTSLRLEHVIALLTAACTLNPHLTDSLFMNPPKKLLKQNSKFVAALNNELSVSENAQVLELTSKTSGRVIKVPAWSMESVVNKVYGFLPGDAGFLIASTVLSSPKVFRTMQLILNKSEIFLSGAGK